MTPLVLAAFAIGTVLQPEAPTCPAPSHVETIQSIKKLPEPVRSALTAKLKDIVDHDQPFDNTDVVRHGAHFNRFSFAWRSGHRFVIATEHGGFAYFQLIYVYDWDGTGHPPKLLAEQSGRISNLCQQALGAIQELPAVQRDIHHAR